MANLGSTCGAILPRSQYLRALWQGADTSIAPIPYQSVGYLLLVPCYSLVSVGYCDCWTMAEMSAQVGLIFVSSERSGMDVAELTVRIRPSWRLSSTSVQGLAFNMRLEFLGDAQRFDDTTPNLTAPRLAVIAGIFVLPEAACAPVAGCAPHL